jgi:hypothetical protein
VNIKDFDFAARFAQVEAAPAPSCKQDDEVATSKMMTESLGEVLSSSDFHVLENAVESLKTAVRSCFSKT